MSLLDQWNDHIIKGNQLSRELENIEALIEKSKGEDICFTAKPNGSTYISVLSPEKMQELSESVITEITKTKEAKEAELEQLMGIAKDIPAAPGMSQGMVLAVGQGSKVKIFPPDTPEVVVLEKHKPATINQEFEKAVHDMVESVKKDKKPDPVTEDKSLSKYPAKKKKGYPDAMTDSAVKQLLSKGKNNQEIADRFGVSKKQVESFIYTHKIQRATLIPEETECP